MINGKTIPTTPTIQELAQSLTEISRRAVDGTVVPIIIDYANQRIIIGASTASASPAKIELSDGDMKVVTAGYGVILPNASGTAYYRVTIADDGAVVATPL